MNTLDTLVSPAPTNVFGILTPTGDIQLRVPTAGQNLEIDASLAMISNGGSGGLICDTSWNKINTLMIVGRRIANQAKVGNLNARNIWFDRRFLQGSFAPLWFPATIITSTGTPGATISPIVTATRVAWENTSAE